MLRTIGIDRIDQLFADVPIDARYPALDLPPALTELEASRHLAQLAAENVSVKDWPCFIGGGAYNHYSPSAVAHIMGQPQFYTAYTPYQPEVSQGTLQASFEFQSLVCELLGMGVANDSVYDGASAVGEAVLMAQRLTRRERVVLAGSVHPHWREVVQTYVAAREVDIATSRVSIEQAKGVLAHAGGIPMDEAFEKCVGMVSKLPRSADVSVILFSDGQPQSGRLRPESSSQ